MSARSVEVSQVLVLRAIGLGDFLTGVPAYRGIRNAFPDATITLAAPAVLEPLASLTGAIDRVLPVAGLGELSPLSAPPDLAVNLHGAGPQSIGDLLATRARRLISHRHPQYPQISGPEWCEEMHEVKRWTSLLAAAGIPADPAELQLVKPIQPPAIPNAVIVHPGASAEARRWPVDRFGAVAGALASAGHSVVLTGSAVERRRCFAVARCAGLDRDSILAGDLDLAGLAALMASARLLISGDTGIAHLATAYATPSVLLFGPTSPLRWGPPAGGPFTVIWRGATGNPHGRWVDPALLEIGSSEVLEAAEARLGDSNLSWQRGRDLAIQAGPVNPTVIAHAGQSTE
jgi:ADP-heptose:LPS heptosyltransferase